MKRALGRNVSHRRILAEQIVCRDLINRRIVEDATEGALDAINVVAIRLHEDVQILRVSGETVNGDRDSAEDGIAGASASRAAKTSRITVSCID